MLKTSFVRSLCICLCWAIWSSALWIAVVARGPGGYVTLLILGGFAPYLLSLNVIEPWLEKRRNA